ncbi:Ger(x)C family spore germination protein [Fictibacillus sp. Mic-4]|uniref:Ger(x)C family spore germination protein n=1 Tax=Fictibacillus sp. Mic-4 TaxID=3132826 RepID=UPI003CF404B2
MRLLRIVVPIFLLLTGCALQQKTIDDIQLIQVLGYDWKDGEYRGTAIFPMYSPDKQETFRLITSSSKTGREILAIMNNKSDKPIEVGQMRTLLIGEALAEKGISTLISTLYRDSNVGNMTKIAVVEDAEHMLVERWKKKSSVDLYISNILRQNEETENLPITNLHTFTYQMWDWGEDPYLPYLTMDKQAVKVDGLALFDHYKLVTKIDERDTFIFMLLNKGSEEGIYESSFSARGKKGNVVIYDIATKKIMKLQKEGAHRKITIHLKIKGEIKEYPTWFDLQKDVGVLEKNVEKHISNHAMELLTFFQKKNIDPLGFGSYLDSKIRHYDEKQYKKDYQNLTFDVKTDVDIFHSGVIE